MVTLVKRSLSFSALLSTLLLICLLSQHLQPASALAIPHPIAQSDTEIAARQNSGQGAVRWDGTSLFIAGTPITLWSGEIHPWRLPVPGLWRDVLQKLKSGGFNAISIYTHWGLTMPANDASSISQKGFNDIAHFLDTARDVGLFVIVRPGPYINAETTGGGMPGWVQNLNATLRTTDDAYRRAWTPYLDAVVDVTKPRQVKLGADGKLDTSAGSVIAVQVENEFQDKLNGAYKAHFDELIAYYKGKGLEVPLTFNSLEGRNDFQSDESLDIWGVDSYPQGFDCGSPSKWSPTKNYTESTHVRSSNPNFIPEFQGGSYDPFGGYGYQACAQLTGPDFIRVFDKDVLSQGLKMISQYMGYGGTNWGHLAFGGLGASLAENRIKLDKLYENAQLGRFLASFPAFSRATLRSRQATNGILVSELRDGDSGFYVVRHEDSTSTQTSSFKLDVQTIGGQFKIPQESEGISLLGRDSVIVPVSRVLSASKATLLYSTADVSVVSVIDGRDVVLAHGHAAQQHELLLQSNGDKLATTAQVDGVTVKDTDKGLLITWKAVAGTAASYVPLTAGDNDLLLILSSTEAAYLSAPMSTAPAGSLEYITGFGEHVLISGLYHVANATVDGSTLRIVGQVNATTTALEVVAPAAVTALTFNGAEVKTTRTDYGSLKGTLSGPSDAAKSWKAPALQGWKSADSLPEIASDFDASKDFIAANLTSTPNSWFEANATNGTVLFADAYGFHAGNVIWRGSVEGGQSRPTGLQLSVQGGKFFAASIWLNQTFLGSLEGSSSVDVANATFSFDALPAGKSILTVLQDSTGLEEASSDNTIVPNALPREVAKKPRGITNFRWTGAQNDAQPRVEWSIAGNFGGERYPDKTRGPLNEGGLYGERQGWHLPGFDDSKWEAHELSAGLTAPGVKFFRTSVDLDVPTGHDLPLSLVFSNDGGTDSQNSRPTSRFLLFVNGWQFGQRLTRWGPQTVFPIPPGILDPRGKNEIAVAAWAVDETGAKASLAFQVDDVFAGDVDYALVNPSIETVRGAPSA
ncbi:glycoside hydrolase family 35 protein [Ceraceosorus bombacis]|uniref:beta-galactosidase n=1 Tax=Ceraceosorus bombacis TaxID=401625 RepID=A0A0P1B8D9_9BASI|nr:glycoside hydrolase family 35 protein [Ceraceosorus bombacis]